MEQLAAELQQRSEEMQAQLLRTPRIVGPRRMLRAYPKLRHGSKLRSLPTLREMLRRAEQENKDDNKNTKCPRMPHRLRRVWHFCCTSLE